MPDFPRDDLIRMTPISAGLEFRADEDGRTMIGYPIVFDQWTEISGWEGNFLERIDPAALTKTLKERRDRVKVLFNHGMDPQIGDKPLGKPSVMEPRARGLYVEVPLARVSFNDDLIELMKVGAIDGQSFRFSVTRDEWEDEPDPSDDNPRGLPQRIIRELKLYEFGPVTFPAYEATTVGIRGADAYRLFLRHRQDFSDAGSATSEPDTPPTHLSVSKETIRALRARLTESTRDPRNLIAL